MRAAIVIVLALALAATTAAAQPTSPHEAAATEAYDRGDLEVALREFEAAYVDTKRPDLLYVIGKLYAARGNCPRAIEHFEWFLASKPGPNATEGAKAEIEKCTAKASTDGGGESSEPPIPESGGGDVVAEPDPGGAAAATGGITTAPSDRRPRDKLAVVLVGGGVALDLVAL